MDSPARRTGCKGKKIYPTAFAWRQGAQARKNGKKGEPEKCEGEEKEIPGGFGLDKFEFVHRGLVGESHDEVVLRQARADSDLFGTGGTIF